MNTMRRTFKTFIILLMTISVISCAGSPAGKSGSFSNDDMGAIQAELDALTADGNLPGLVMWIDNPEYKYEGASGFADEANQVAMTVDGAFRIGSITKMFTAATVLRLAEEEILGLDDNLAQWLPEVSAQLPYGDEITLRQLLSHTSGLFNIVEHESYYPDVFAAIEVDVTTGFVTLDCVARDPNDTLERYVYGKSAYSAPGSGFRYSNTNYHLLGMVIEAASDMPVAEAYAEYIYQPLGMTSTFLDCYEEPKADVVRGYTGFGPARADLTELHESVGWTAGGMVSTASDLIKFGRGLYGGNLFEDPATLTEMTSPADNSPNGLGVFLFGESSGHSGGIAGFRSVINYSPSLDAVTLMLYNHDSIDPEEGLRNVMNVVRPMITNEG